MKLRLFAGLAASCLTFAAVPSFGQQNAAALQISAADSTLSPVPLEWTPPALDELSRMAPVKSSFTLDRNLLAIASGMLPDAEEGDRQVIRKLDGVSVHTMRFPDEGIPDETAVNSIRAAYHLRGWKHIVTTTRSGGPVHNGTTDLWVVMDGVNLRGAVILAETPRSLTLVTIAGNLNPVDLLHLRGHFGIPRFDGDSLNSVQ
ncbi:MAG TPA: hypothetical protein VHW46_04190 [Terracidiphilus sp.]|jgi:hypothetical protein|nr:hypothetical protein [Terracidiphilus sp.]